MSESQRRTLYAAGAALALVAIVVLSRRKQPAGEATYVASGASLAEGGFGGGYGGDEGGFSPVTPEPAPPAADPAPAPSPINIFLPAPVYLPPPAAPVPPPAAPVPAPASPPAPVPPPSGPGPSNAPTTESTQPFGATARRAQLFVKRDEKLFQTLDV